MASSKSKAYPKVSAQVHLSMSNGVDTIFISVSVKVSKDFIEMFPEKTVDEIMVNHAMNKIKGILDDRDALTPQVILL